MLGRRSPQRQSAILFVLISILLLLFAILSQVLGQAGSAIYEHSGFHHPFRMVMEFMVAGAAVATAWSLGYLWARPNFLLTLVRVVVALFAALAANMFLNSLATVIQDSVGSSVESWWLILAVCAVVWIVMSIVLLPRVQKWFMVQTDRCPNVLPEQVRGPVVLIMLVSALRKECIPDLSGQSRVTVTLKNHDTCSSIQKELACLDLEADIGALSPGSPPKHETWPWQQLMRGIFPFVRRRLPEDKTTVVLIGSKGESGSYGQLQACEAFFCRYSDFDPARGVTIKTSCEYSQRQAKRGQWTKKRRHDGEGGIDFENFEEVRDHILNVVHLAANEVGGDHVFVDVTGGQKTTSIAAAVATTGETGFCQYVQTNKPHAIKFYDLHLLEAPSI